LTAADRRSEVLNFIPSSDQLSAIFEHAAAPAFLLAGVGAFISVLMSRAASVVDRIRTLSDISDDDGRAKLKADIPYLKRRAILLHSAAYTALLSAMVTTLLLAVSVLTAFMGLQHAFGGALLFGVATALLTVALFRFSQEIRVALTELDKYGA
jgi:Protein of unknown function (DUF2721)